MARLPGHLRRDLVITLLLAAATLLTYHRVVEFEFVNIDDPQYVVANPQVLAGLTPAGIAWASTTFAATNWHPLTWLSHMLDVELFGVDAGWHHLGSLVIHVLNSMLLFLLLERMTGGSWRSAIVAALFALHPIHVESVAWVSERKDVLSTLFWILTIWSYVRYVEQATLKRYMLVALCFAFGLMTKPMVITLPFVLLLLDHWPLDRLRFDARNGHVGTAAAKSALSLLLEKAPLFLMAIASAVITFYAQEYGGAVGSVERYSVAVRLANAVVAYLLYVQKMLWPTNLAFFYPHAGMPPPWLIVVSSTLLLLITGYALKMLRNGGYLAVGWFWYLGTLVPVIGLVQVGQQSMADRYAYIPSIGFFIMLVWGIAGVLGMNRPQRIFYSALCPLVLLILAVMTRAQADHWADDIALTGHALEVTRDNHMAHDIRGYALFNRGDIEAAKGHFLEAMRINPRHPRPFFQMGVISGMENEQDEALRYYAHLLMLRPDNVAAHNNVGRILYERGSHRQSLVHYRRAMELDPDMPEARINAGMAFEALGDLEQAVSQYRQALDRSPENLDVLNRLGIALSKQGKPEEAIRYFERAIRLQPENGAVYGNMGGALMMLGRMDEAIRHYREALRLNPDDATARMNLQRALANERQ